MQNKLIIGVVLALALLLFATALRQLNGPGNLAAVGGYFILLLMLGGVVEGFRRYHKEKKGGERVQ